MPYYNKNIKCVIVGDNASGKKTLLFSYIAKQPELNDLPAIYKPPSTQITIGKYHINLLLCDTKGDDKYDRIRPLCYPDTDIFIICFSLIDASTLDHVRTKWYPEIENYCKNNVPILLVGTKLDLLKDKKLDIGNKNSKEFDGREQEHDIERIYCQNGLEMAKTIGAEKYIECSAMDNKSVEIVFESAAKMVLFGSPTSINKRKRGCCL